MLTEAPIAIPTIAEIYFRIAAVGVIIIAYSSHYLIKKYFLKQYLSIEINKNYLQIDYLSHDKLRVIKTRTILLSDIHRFSNFNFGGSLTFTVKLKHDRKFSIHENKNKFNQDLDQLIEDFKTLLIEIKFKEKPIKYRNFYQTRFATFILFLAIISAFALSIFVIFLIIQGDKSFLVIVKFIFMILLILGYIINYTNNNDDS
jgi:hypothetical protein